MLDKLILRDWIQDHFLKHVSSKLLIYAVGLRLFGQVIHEHTGTNTCQVTAVQV